MIVKMNKKNVRQTGKKEGSKTKRELPRWSIPAAGGALLLIGVIYFLGKAGPQKTEGPLPIPTPKPGDIQVIETFDNVYQWGTEKNLDSSIEEGNGQLSIQTSKPNSFFTSAFLSMWGTGDNSIYLAGGQPAWLQQGNIDVTFEATVERNTGVAIFGAACRFQNDQNFYEFILDSNGYYAIGKTIDGTNYLLTKGTTGAVHSMQVINKVHIVCSGLELSLAVNDTSLALVRDITLKKGIMALIGGAGASNFADVKVNYDNLVIKAP
jgi:hypothetical protein